MKDIIHWFKLRLSKSYREKYAFKCISKGMKSFLTSPERKWFSL